MITYKILPPPHEGKTGIAGPGKIAYRIDTSTEPLVVATLYGYESCRKLPPSTQETLGAIVRGVGAGLAVGARAPLGFVPDGGALRSFTIERADAPTGEALLVVHGPGETAPPGASWLDWVEP